MEVKTNIKTLKVRVKDKHKTVLERMAFKVNDRNGKWKMKENNRFTLSVTHYKSKAMQAEFVEVSEKYTTQICLCCGCISHSSPRGRTGLGIREWTCTQCGAMHDRDINAAKNILALGHQRLAGGIPVP